VNCLAYPVPMDSIFRFFYVQSHVKTRQNIKNPAGSNLDIVP